MFRKNRKPVSQELAPAAAPPKTTIGQTVLSREVSVEPTKSYEGGVSDRVIALQNRQSAFLKELAKRGVTAAELPGLLADAMNASTFPRVIRGLGFKDAAVLTLLDGHVPAEALVIDETDFESRIQSGDTTMLFVSDDIDQVESNTEGITTTWLELPLDSPYSQPVHPDILANIDAHIYSQPPAG